ncbi:uncharacterized protein LOC117822369 [Xyrichtys novacula]|uniref:Uncharacterized protein LOC117822369 n=1 Tax=Xyrichtys novacula TaxID=13765 RepID=A0AAV1FPD6_XYRNO|nr:uncharacterized protein LOC117822369 [Xyrichtys novacula]
MPPKTIRSALAEMLEDLTKENFDKFCHRLLDHKEVKRRQVEGKSYLDIADLLDSAFTEARSHLVAVELLKEINCGKEAAELEGVIAGLSSKPGSGGAARPTGGAAGETMAEEKHFVDKHQLQLIQRVERITSDIQLLMDILSNLTKEEVKHFTEVLLRTDFKRLDLYGYWFELLQTEYQEIVFLIVMALGQHSVETTREVLKNMKRTDLLQRLTDASSRSKKGHPDEPRPALIQKVAMMAAVRQMLLDTLHCLSEKEFQNFTKLLEQRIFQMNLRPTAHVKRLSGDRAEKVDLMLKIYGQQSVKLTREILEEMKRTDLTQILSETSSESKEEQSVVEKQPSLTQRVERMTSYIHLLMDILSNLTKEEVKHFTKILLRADFKRLNSYSYQFQLLRTEYQEIVFLIVTALGQHSVETTREVLKNMKRTDLLQRLTDASSRSKKGHPDEPRPALIQKVAMMVAVRQMLLDTLHCLSEEELQNFTELLQQRIFQMNLRPTAHVKRLSGDREEKVDLMLKIYGQQSVKLTREILEEMKRTDLTQMLSETSSESKGKTSFIKMLSTITNQNNRINLLKYSFVITNIKNNDFTMTADHQQLLETLGELSVGELEKFKHVLQYTKMKGLPKIPRDRLETTDKLETVKLMVEIYGEQSVEVTRDVLKRIYRMELVQKLSQGSPESQEPSRSLGPEACGYNLPPWTKLEPGVNSIGGDESPTYSLECDTGNYFECSVSGLRWVCKEKVSFQYQFCSWEGHMERMENINYMPAGPLMNIRVITGKFHELYLPHWICTDDNPDMLKEFAVLHIDDCGDVVESVAEVTPSHVKLLEPVFSPRAALMKVGFPVKISCSVLIYYKPNTPFLKLHVYVIPCDPALQRTVDQKEEGFQKIKKPRPDGYLKMQQGFSLTADIESAKIYPEKITLRYDNQDPNFYEVFIEKPDGNFTLELSQMSKGRALSQKVWSCEIRKVDYQCLAPEEKHSVDHQLSALVQKSVTITTTDRERLLKILEQLEQTELKRFKWFLQNTDLLADLPSISPSELENKDRLEMVDLMLRVYSTRSIELSKKILEKMPRNDLVQALSDIS